MAADRGPVVVAVTAAFLAISTAFIVLRMVSRLLIVQRGATLDDAFILVAWLLDFGLSFAICFATKYGLGQHESTLSNLMRSNLDKLDYTFQVLYNPALMATKTSILVFYLTLAKEQKTFRWLTYATIAIVNVAGLALSLLNFFECRPLTDTFDEPKPSNAHCIDFVTLYLSSAPVNIVTDLMILLLPLPILKSLKLPRKQKIILYITFGFGVFATAVDVVRTSYLQSAAVSRAKALQDGHMQNTSDVAVETDFSWYASLSFMWSAIEVNVGIMCACVPALKPLAARFMPNLLKDVVKRGAKHYGSAFSPPRANTTDRGSKHSNASQPGVLQEDFAPDALSGPANDEDVEKEREREESNVPNLMEFLNSPTDTGRTSHFHRTDTVATNASVATQHTFFDFVNMGKGKGIVNLTNRESLRPNAEVTVLFFLWGFAYGLLNTLNSQVQLIAGLNEGQSIAIHGMYFVGYLVAPLTFGRFLLHRYGFKACYMAGLIIYGTGTLIFWPAAVLLSFSAFMVSNFIVGLGLSTLEVAANPFIALCGPPEYSEMRLNLSQSFQAVGSIISPLLASKLLFKNVLDAPSLVDVQWTYLGITFFTYILAYIYYVMKLPEVTDEQLEEAACRAFESTSPTADARPSLTLQPVVPELLAKLKRTRILWYTLGICVTAQFFYVGAQESVAVFSDSYLAWVQPTADPVNYAAVAHTLFAVSRFLAAVSGFFLRPRWQLAFLGLGGIIFSALAMHFRGLTAGSMMLCVYFFEGPIFPLLYAIPLRGLGKYTKDAAVLITASTSGGALLPGMYYLVAQTKSGNYGSQYGYCVNIACFGIVTLCAMYLSFVTLARKQVDQKLPLRGRARAPEPADEPEEPTEGRLSVVATTMFEPIARLASPRRRSSMKPAPVADTLSLRTPSPVREGKGNDMEEPIAEVAEVTSLGKKNGGDKEVGVGAETITPLSMGDPDEFRRKTGHEFEKEHENESEPFPPMQSKIVEKNLDEEAPFQSALSPLDSAPAPAVRPSSTMINEVEKVEEDQLKGGEGK